MRTFLISILVLLTCSISFGQNQNLSGGNIFDGEPYLSIDPSDTQHMVVAWMGYLPFTKVLIKTKVTFNGGQTWSEVQNIPHMKPLYGSADPSIDFDNSGNVFLSYIDYSKLIDSGAVYVAKSVDGGLSWDFPIEVINAHSDAGKYPIDRPWISIDRSGGAYDGNIYITTMPPKVFGPLLPPYHPYFIKSSNGGNSFNSWVYLDTINWLSGNIIGQPMPTNCVSSDGSFHAVYPSYLISQSFYAQYIIASSDDAGNSFTYHSVLTSANAVPDSLAKKGYLLRANPANADHLAFFYLDVPYGDMDIFLKESFDKGINWSPAIRINDDPIANNRMQDLVWADFDLDGDLAVSWRDRRNGSDSTYTTASEIWGAVRYRDSTRFAANFRISDTIVDYDTILAFAGNDFMCIKFRDDTLYAVWGDTRDGKLNIWFQKTGIDGSVLSIQQISSEKIPEVILYPNPIASNLFIEAKNMTKVTVYNANGKNIFSNEGLNGVNSMEINTEHFASGLYIVEVTTSEGVVTKKILKP